MCERHGTKWILDDGLACKSNIRANKPWNCLGKSSENLSLRVDQVINFWRLTGARGFALQKPHHKGAGVQPLWTHSTSTGPSPLHREYSQLPTPLSHPFSRQVTWNRSKKRFCYVLLTSVCPYSLPYLVVSDRLPGGHHSRLAQPRRFGRLVRNLEAISDPYEGEIEESSGEAEIFGSCGSFWDVELGGLCF